MSRRLIVLLLLLMHSMVGIYAQQNGVEYIGITEGLSQGFVPCLFQDQEGFIWAGTKNGLNRYDGREFLVFTHDPDDPFSIADDQAWSVTECGEFLLIGTNAGVLDFFHKKTRRFFHLPLKEGNTAKAPYIPKILLDADRNIWLVAGEFQGNRQCCVIRTPPGFWDNLAANPALVETLKPAFIESGRVISATLSIDRSTFYFNTPQELTAINTRSGLHTRIGQIEASCQITYPEWESDSRGNLWGKSDHALHCLSATSRTDYPFDFKASFSGILQSDLAIISSQTEILAIPLAKIQATGRITSNLAVWRLPCTDIVLDQLMDASGNVWIGLNGRGIIKTNPGQHRVEQLFPGLSIYGNIFVERDGTIVAMHITGLSFYPANSNCPTARFLRQHPGTRIYEGWRHAADQDGNDWLMAVFEKQALLVKTTADGTQKTYPFPVYSRIPGNLMADASGVIWIGYHQSLLRFDPKSEQWQTYSLQTVLPINPEIYCLVKTPDGTLWMGTQAGLLEVSNLEKGEITYQLHTSETGALRQNAVSSLLPDPSNPQLLWMTTKGGGLTRMDLKTRQFTHIYSKNGLPNDVLYGVLPDKKGLLWMSSNKGVIRYNPADGAIRNFTETDGFQSDEFNSWAYAPGPAGALMFGGIKGLNVFHPEDFNDNPHVPRVYLTGLHINNQPVTARDSTGVLNQAMEFTDRISLRYDQNNVTLMFAALEFTASDKNKFRWILEGAETNWHAATGDRSATYLNLQPGSYTFKVMAANGDGIWNQVPATLKIDVAPPWYRSFWAYLVYVAILAGLIYGYLRFRISRLRLEQQVALEHLNAERLEELDKFKSKLFTNISHEFRTPLTVILGVAEQLESASRQSQPGQLPAGITGFTTLIKRNGQNLLRLINQILDLARLEGNVLKINNIQGDILAYIRYVAESLHSLANVKNVLLQVESQVATSALIMDYDPERLMHILHNLLSNAVKFTPSGGKVRLQIRLAEGGERPVAAESALLGTDPQPHVVITVADTGVGIAPEALPHVFDRFFQADNQQEARMGGSGIGLSLTYELVKLMEGDISVESHVGRGTTFTVRLPIKKTAMPESMSVALPERVPIRESTRSALPNTQLPVLLLIEDNPDVVEYLTVCLNEQYQLDFAYNGAAGIERAMETIPDLIISDVMMPGKDGFEVCATVKNDARTSHIPLVLLTAKAGVEDRISGLRRGADAYLAKPFHPDELQAILSNLLEMRQKLQAKYSQLGANFVETTGQQPPAAMPDMEDAFIQKLRTLVEENLAASNLSVEDFSRMLGMSYPVVHRKVTALTGRSLTLYIRSIRLQKARVLLTDPALSIAEVAYQTGFNDPKFFSRFFSEEFGLPPTQYRQTP